MAGTGVAFLCTVLRYGSGQGYYATGVHIYLTLSLPTRCARAEDVAPLVGGAYLVGCGLFLQGSAM